MKLKIRSVGGLLKRRWKRAILIVVGLAVAGYATSCAAISLSTSPADQKVGLADGRELAYRTVREAPPGSPRIILVHGAPADCSSWDFMIKRHGEALDGLEVIAVDRLGYGKSTPGVETSLAAQAQSLEPLLGDGGAILVGHSQGGPIVLRAAADLGDRVRAVVLVAGACDANMQDAQWARKLGCAVSFLMPTSWDVANRELLALTDENDAMRELLANVRCPVVIIHGTWDPVCPHDGTVGYLKAKLTSAPEIRVVSLSRAGHNLHLSHAKNVAEEIAQATRTR